jgi:dolichol-phosphate mannosyltransferase
MISLVIPTYNERQNITPLVRRVISTLERVIDSFEIIIVDDDSPDGTWQVAQELAKEEPHVTVLRRCGERGLATAVVAGWKAARGDILGVMDGDLQHPPEALRELADAALNAGADIVVASRHVDGGGIGEWGLTRRFISWAGGLLAFLLLPKVLRLLQDPMSGFFLMRHSVVENINLNPKGYKILLEILSKGKYQTVIEIPYVFEERKDGKSKLGPKQYVDFFMHLGQLTWETGHIGRFLSFCMVGLSGIFVNEGALTFFTETIGLYYIYSSMLAVEISIVSNFLLNEFWTFRDKSNRQPMIKSRMRRLVKFNLICAVGACINMVVLISLTDFIRLHYMISNLCGICISTLWNYAMNSNIVFELPIKHKRFNLSL